MDAYVSLLTFDCRVATGCTLGCLHYLRPVAVFRGLSFATLALDSATVGHDPYD